MAMLNTGLTDSYAEKLARLIETETQMGERSALIGELADALSHFPDVVEIGADHIVVADHRIEASEWPSFRDLGVLFQLWREQRASVQAMWREMSAEERAGVNAPPAARGADLARAWV